VKGQWVGQGAESLGLTGTRQGLELEQWAVKYVDATKGTCPALNPGFAPGSHLSEEKREAVALRSRHARSGVQFSRRGRGWKDHDIAGSSARAEGGRAFGHCHRTYLFCGAGLARRGIHRGDNR
jgi:hypothetical protein